MNIMYTLAERADGRARRSLKVLQELQTEKVGAVTKPNVVGA